MQRVTLPCHHEIPPLGYCSKLDFSFHPPLGCFGELCLTQSIVQTAIVGSAPPETSVEKIACGIVVRLRSSIKLKTCTAGSFAVLLKALAKKQDRIRIALFIRHKVSGLMPASKSVNQVNGPVMCRIYFFISVDAEVDLLSGASFQIFELFRSPHFLVKWCVTLAGAGRLDLSKLWRATIVFY